MPILDGEAMWLTGFAPTAATVCWYCGMATRAPVTIGVVGYLCEECRAWATGEPGAAQALFEELATRILETDWPDGQEAMKTAVVLARWLAHQKHRLQAGEKLAPWDERTAGQGGERSGP